MSNAYSDIELINAAMVNDREDEISNLSHKVVTVRKRQRCWFGEALFDQVHEIEPGKRAIRETGLMDGDGWLTCYACEECLTRWIKQETEN